ncbi:MAG: histidine--tRNA ligase [Candidatus Portnoybacteria bacterium]|nr:histidine--tRNA ligase [Candidatus Portnoybacteria bacterium]
MPRKKQTKRGRPKKQTKRTKPKKTRGRPKKSKRGRPSKPKKPKIKKISVQSPKGTHDILPENQKYWIKMRKTINNVAEEYGFKRIDTPIFEDVNLYIKGTGQSTDIIQKEIYTFKTKGGDAYALRPEFTPGIVRSYIEHGMKKRPQPVKLYTLGPVFRHDKPQAGRYRQFYQFNFESIGDQSSLSDVQIIQAFIHILKRLKIKNFTLYINSIGCPICAPEYKKALVQYYRKHRNDICVDCKKRLKENPLRLLDCKKTKCKNIIPEAPQVVDFLCDECKEHFKETLELLDELEISYILDPLMVRGLDYYTKTVFEIWEGDQKSEIGALVGGGRYDNLVEMFGGKPTPAVGAAAGFERIISIIKKQDIKVREKKKPEIFMVQLGEMGKRRSLKLFEEFRKKGIRVGEAFSKDSMKSQLKAADKRKAKIALIIGQKEAIEENVILRDMTSGNQEVIPMNKIMKEVKKRLK